MGSYKISDLGEFGPRRSIFIKEEDVPVLMGYVYGRYEMAVQQRLAADGRNKVESIRDLLLALFSCGSDWAAIFTVSIELLKSVNSFISDINVSEYHNKHYLKNILREACWLNYMFRPVDHSENLISSISLLVTQWEVKENFEKEAIIDLELYKSALEGKGYKHLQIKYKDFDFASSSLTKPLLLGDGAALGKRVNTELLRLQDRVSWLSEGDRKLFLDRTKAFRDFGWGFMLTGIRGVAEALGCPMPPPDPRTLVFYAPTAPASL